MKKRSIQTFQNESLSSIPWPDTSFINLLIDTASIIITCEGTLGNKITITAHQYISIQQPLHFEENIIDDLTITTESTFIKSTITEMQNKYNNTFHDSDELDSSGPWYHLQITFIDFSTLELIAQSIEAIVYE